VKKSDLRLIRDDRDHEDLNGEPDPKVLPRLQVTDTGKIKATMANIRLIILSDRRWKGRLGYDTFTRSVTLDGEPISDAQVIDLRIDIGICYGFEPTKSRIWEVLHIVGLKQTSNSLAGYLDTITWDGTPRIDTWLLQALNVEDTPLHRTFARRWCISAIARAYEPGCKVDTVLLLVGTQGIGKSTAFKILAGEKWFADTKMRLDNKDAYLQLQRVWIYEDAEMTSAKGTTAERVKAFVTSTHDNFRPPYGRVVVKLPRQTVFVATTNDDTPLDDPTGSRRFWPVVAPGPLDANWLRANREQLWAEAVVAYEAGEPWHLADAEEHDRRMHAVSFTRMDAWTAHIEAWVAANVAPFTIRDVLIGAVGIPAHQHDRSHQVRVGQVLRQLGYDKRKARVGEMKDGTRPWLWSLSGKKGTADG